MEEIGVDHFLILSGALVFVAVLGLACGRRSAMHYLLAVILVNLAAMINLAAFSIFHGTWEGQAFILVILAIIASELVVGFSIRSAHRRHISGRAGHGDQALKG